MAKRNAAKDFALNYAALFMLLVLTADGLYADWSFNPVYDIVFAKVQLNLFFNAHASSILAIVCAAYYMAFVRKDGLAVAVFAAFGTASMHELGLYVVDEVAFKTTSGANAIYAAYLLVFLVIGWVIIKRYHKRVWAATLALTLAWYFVLAGLTLSGYGVGSTLSSTVPFAQSALFYNPITNLAEVVSWLAPVSLWFLPRKWFRSRPSSLPSGESPSLTL
jgi:hypothetical protein